MQTFRIVRTENLTGIREKLFPGQFAQRLPGKYDLPEVYSFVGSFLIWPS
jgi:hypothetical protein